MQWRKHEKSTEKAFVVFSKTTCSDFSSHNLDT